MTIRIDQNYVVKDDANIAKQLSTDIEFGEEIQLLHEYCHLTINVYHFKKVLHF